MKKSVLVTGINGFVGEHVAKRFNHLGYDVIGTARQDAPEAEVASSLSDYHSADLLDQSSVNKLSLTGVKAVIHLAGRSSVGESFDKPTEYITENSLMTYNIYSHLKDTGFDGRVVSVSTGALYDPNQQLPLNEESRTASNSPYAIGKLSAEAVALYFRNQGIDSVVARPFNHIGPGQGKGFLLPDMYTQLRNASPDRAIRVGNLDTRRDYTDVRDIARAYSDLVETEKLNFSVYNVCSSKSLSGFQILDIIRKVTGLDDVSIEIDPSRLRPNEIMDIRGSFDLLHTDTGWAPSRDIHQTIADFVKRAQS